MPADDLIHQIVFWLNDEDLDVETEDDDEDDFDLDLDLDDPYIAMQYYDHDDVNRYIAMERLMRGDEDGDSLSGGDIYDSNALYLID